MNAPAVTRGALRPLSGTPAVTASPSHGTRPVHPDRGIIELLVAGPRTLSGRISGAISQTD